MGDIEYTERDRLRYDEIEKIARALPITSSLNNESIPELLSIDLDFFVSAPLGGVDNDELVRLASWNGDECRSAIGATARWRERYAMLMRHGWEPDEVMRFAGAFELEAFEVDLRRQILPPQQALYADSHAWAALALRRLSLYSGTPVSVTSFDAHHDSGYINKKGESWRDAAARLEDGVSCDDWVWAGFDRGWISDVTLVYPDWEGLYEWELRERPILPARYRERIHPCVYSDWAERNTAHPRSASDMIVVRSSEWIPPWLQIDKTLNNWVEKLTESIVCLDCDARTDGIKIGPWDACVAREWER